jgi:DNA-3-methyladenine glycosylase II
MHRQHAVTLDVLGPWSLRTSREFWEGFAPAVLPAQARGDGAPLHTVFSVDHDWSRAEADVTQDDGAATVVVTGDGDLNAAAAQVAHSSRWTSTLAPGPMSPLVTG